MICECCYNEFYSMHGKTNVCVDCKKFISNYKVSKYIPSAICKVIRQRISLKEFISKLNLKIDMHVEIINKTPTKLYKNERGTVVKGKIIQITDYFFIVDTGKRKECVNLVDLFNGYLKLN